MEKRVLIAVLLSVAVMYGFSYLFPQPVVQPPVKTAVQGAPSSASLPMAQLPVSTPAQPAIALPLPPTQGEEKDVTVETDLYRAVFSTRGGRSRNSS